MSAEPQQPSAGPELADVARYAAGTEAGSCKWCGGRGERHSVRLMVKRPCGYCGGAGIRRASMNKPHNAPISANGGPPIMTPDPSQIPAGPPLAEEARYADPHDDPAYQEYVEAAAERCRCDYDRPCEGVLCGGLCDERRHEFYEANEDSA